MQGWPGGPPSLARLNPIYSEAEDTSAGRSKASSSGYGSQRGSGGGSVSDRPPPSIPNGDSTKEIKLSIWQNEGSEDPYTIYSTCSVRDEIGSDHYAARSTSTYSKKKFDDLLTKQGRYLPKVTRGYPRKIEHFSKTNEGFVDEDIKEVAESDGYVSKSETESAVPVHKKVSEYDSMQSDPFLLYSQFIKQEEEKASAEAENEVKIETESSTDGSSTSDTNSIAREEYVKSLLQDIAVAIDEAIATRRTESHGGLLKEARERVSMGLLALRRAGPQDLRQLSKVLAKGPAKPLPRPVLPPPPSPHARKPSLWQQYYMRANSVQSVDSNGNTYNAPIRPEAQFTLGAAGEVRLAGRLAAARRARCICRLFGATLALFFFLLALVLCSLLLSGGRAMFGSMM